MKLPNADQAVVPEPKVLYLLSEEKSGGKDKFFKGFGFSVAPHNNVDVDKGGGSLQTGFAKIWSAQVKKDEPPTAILPKHDLPRQG